jgi:hypothetical protein
MPQGPKKIAVIGAGAAGYFAAIHLAENRNGPPHRPKPQVFLLESSGKPLGKVLISGGGRCNVTNSLNEINSFLNAYPRGAKELRSVFHRFSNSDTRQWFKRHGVELKTEPDGRMFPISDSSQTIVDCLQSQATKLGVKLLSKTKVDTILKSGSKFIVSSSSGDELVFDTVVLCTGGSRNGHRIAESLGHKIVEPVPSLFSFGISDPRLKSLQGLSFQNVKAQLFVTPKKKAFVDTGPILITHWGLSGPAIIRLSSKAARELAAASYSARLELNLLPNITPAEIEDRIRERKQLHPRRSVAGDNFFPLPRRYWISLISLLHKDSSLRWADVNKGFISSLLKEICAAEFQVASKGAFKDEFVTCGGVSLKEIDFRTMQSKICDGLYFAGEILDIDGITGGFNFQSAWSTGWIAGTSA